MYKIENVPQGTNIVNEDRYARLKSEMSSREVNVQSRLCATGRLSAWTPSLHCVTGSRSELFAPSSTVLQQ